jgi:hypothetical protein
VASYVWEWEGVMGLWTLYGIDVAAMLRAGWDVGLSLDERATAEF